MEDQLGNASSFFDLEGLGFAGREAISVRQRKAALFSTGVEYHAFISPIRLSEYLFNINEIHSDVRRGWLVFW